MKKIIAILTATLLICGNGFSREASKSSSKEQSKQEVVYVCTGGYATKYHRNKKCKGLDNCKGRIIEIPKSEAMKKGRTPCKLCH
jgi:hypothetical protein